MTSACCPMAGPARSDQILGSSDPELIEPGAFDTEGVAVEELFERGTGPHTASADSSSTTATAGSVAITARARLTLDSKSRE